MGSLAAERARESQKFAQHRCPPVCTILAYDKWRSDAGASSLGGNSLTISIIGVVESLRDLSVNVDEFSSALGKMSLLRVSRKSDPGDEGAASGGDRAGGGSQETARLNPESLGEH